MAALTNPPFTRQKDEPPMHLRALSPEEYDQLERMRSQAELAVKLSKLKKDAPAGQAPSVETPQIEIET